MLPLSQYQAFKAAQWLKDNFGKEIEAATANTPYDFSLVAAIACQETAQRWLLWIKDYDPQTVLARCVFDASGDFPGTTRSAFPKNKADFANRYGKALTDMLVNEANKMRAMPQPGDPNGWNAGSMLYKGYGIFQYDLQHIQTDPKFFVEKKWYNFSDCLQRLIEQFNLKIKQQGTLEQMVEAYNGRGDKAKEYAKNVLFFKNMFA